MNKKKPISESLEVVFVKKLKQAYIIKYDGKIVAYGKKGMYICRDRVGFCWFETLKNLQASYRLFNISEDCFFVMMKVCVKKLGKPFSIERKNKPVFLGREDDIFISFPSGVCYIFRVSSKGKSSVTYVHSDGSQESNFIFCTS